MNAATFNYIIQLLEDLENEVFFNKEMYLEALKVIPLDILTNEYK
jgi:hypothetical protein